LSLSGGGIYSKMFTMQYFAAFLEFSNFSSAMLCQNQEQILKIDHQLALLNIL
jgi:hypothetical protein